MADSGDWCLIESDPGVFTELIEGFGVEGLQCDEVYDLNFTDAISDAVGFIFLYKWDGNAIESGKRVEGEKLKSIFYAEQIVRNACATQAIINVLLNLPTDSVNIGDTLSDFKSFVADFDSKMKGSALTNCDKLRTVHNSFSPPQVYEIDDKQQRATEDAYHFVGYVPIDGTVYELDGLKGAPIEHGAIPDGKSWIEVIAPVITQRMASVSHDMFNLLAIVPSRIQMYQQELIDVMATPAPTVEQVADIQNRLRMEGAKAAAQRTENSRRRHNYLPFIIEVLKVLAEKDRLVDVVKKAKERSAELRARMAAQKA